MLVQYYQPYALSPGRLDRYLASGWFRNSTLLFRSRVLCLEGEMLDVVNIRLPLQQYTFPHHLQKLWRRTQRSFTTRIGPARIDKDKNHLYHLHKKKFHGFIYPNLKQFLHSEGLQRVFNTWQVEVFDGEQLIAYSFFDVGQQSISSIIGIYDEKYSRHSLGIYSMLAEVQFALDNNMKYYYPGFIFNKPSPFDYKLRLGEYQTYDWKKGSWVKADKLETESFSGRVILENIHLLEDLLHSNKIRYQKKLYPYFSLGYIDSRIEPFVKAPVLILLTAPSPEHWVVVEYLPDDAVYMLSVMECCSSFDYILDQQEHMGSIRHKGELKRVYKYNELLAMSSDPNKMIQEIVVYFNRFQKK